MAPQPELTALERQVLARFFSRIEPREHADVYLVRKLPQEIRATLNGLYSRSHLSMRLTFLRRLQQGLEKQGKTLADLPLPEAASEDVLAQVLVEKAGEFLRTYAIDHGHSSLREGAMLQIAVENVSQLVTRFLQRERRASFEESSTRYISFSREGHWRDAAVAAAGQPWRDLYEDNLRETFALYQEAVEALQACIRRQRPCAPGEDAKAWERAVRAEALDSARYLLTPALHTKFGLVTDARTLAEMISACLSHPLAEFRLVGERLKEEAEREVPTLLAHARRNEFLASTREIAAAVADELGRAPSEPPREAAIEVALLEAPADLDERLLASLLYEKSGAPYDALRARLRALDARQRPALFERLLAGRGLRDAMPEAFEGGGVLDFELLVDFGAYRDIGRHRKGFQQQQAMTVAHGFVVPPLFDEGGLGERYRGVLRAAGERAARLAERFPHESAYVIPFAYRQRVRLRFDPRQMAYFTELRSAPEGHFSYREVAIRMGQALREKAPLYARYVRLVEDAVFLGRVEAEQGAGERRARRAEEVRKLGWET